MATARAPESEPAAHGAPDVFVSYARENREQAEHLADALAENKLRVWWDRDLVAGSEFAAEIERQLTNAGVVIGLWSNDSVRSAFVRDECTHALRADKLVPVRIEDVDLPLGFGQLHTLDLLEWSGDADDPSFQALLLEVERRRGRPRAPAAASPLRGPVRRSMRRSVIAAITVVAACAVGAAGYFAKHAWDEHAQAQRLAEVAQKLQRDRADADQHFRAGLEFQYADVPRLENALNEYLSALERLPPHARARYYLAHVYAQTDRSADALGSFKLALAGTEALLDRSQQDEAKRQITVLGSGANEAAPVTRGLVAVAAERPASVLLPSTEQPLPPPVATVRSPPTAAAARPTPEPAPSIASTGPKLPPRIEPPAATETRLARSVDGLFDDNKERRITATTSLVVEPDDLSDAVPLAVERALLALRNPPLAPSASSGVVNTLVLLQSALPGTLISNQPKIEQLLSAADGVGDYTRLQSGKVRDRLEQAKLNKPIGYLQIASEAQRPVAEKLVERLRNFGYAAPAIEVVEGRAPAQTQLRVQGRSERSYARWLAKVITELAGVTPVVEPLRNANPKVDTYEIWLGRDVSN